MAEGTDAGGSAGGRRTIRLRASVVVVDDGRTLLVPHFYRDGSTLWYPPGGAVDFGETLRVAAAREFAEETGLSVEVGQLLTVTESVDVEKGYHSVCVAFSGRVLDYEVVPEVTPFGIKVAQWFPTDGLPPIVPYMRPAVDLAVREALS